MGEVRTLRWLFLADIDRKYGRPQISTPPTPASSGSPRRRRSSSARTSRGSPSGAASPGSPPGSRPLLPSMWTPRELFPVRRTFRVLVSVCGRPRLMGPFVVTGHTTTSCQFRRYDKGHVEQGRARFRTWVHIEQMLQEDRVRWISGVPRELWPSTDEIGRRFQAAAQAALSTSFPSGQKPTREPSPPRSRSGQGPTSS